MSRTTWWIHCNIPWKLHHRHAHRTDRRRQAASKLKHSFVCQRRHRRDKASNKNEQIHNVFCGFSKHTVADVLNVYVFCVESPLKVLAWISQKGDKYSVGGRSNLSFLWRVCQQQRGIQRVLQTDNYLSHLNKGGSEVNGDEWPSQGKRYEW